MGPGKNKKMKFLKNIFYNLNNNTITYIFIFTLGIIIISLTTLKLVYIYTIGICTNLIFICIILRRLLLIFLPLFLHNNNKLPPKDIIKIALVNKYNIIWLIILIIILYKRDWIYLLLEDIINIVEISLFQPILCDSPKMSGKYFEHSKDDYFTLRGSRKIKGLIRANDSRFKNKWANLNEYNIARKMRLQDLHPYPSLNSEAVDPTQFKVDCFMVYNNLQLIRQTCPNLVYLPSDILCPYANSFIGKYLKAFHVQIYLDHFHVGKDRPHNSKLNIIKLANDIKNSGESAKFVNQPV